MPTDISAPTQKGDIMKETEKELLRIFAKDLEIKELRRDILSARNTHGLSLDERLELDLDFTIATEEFYDALARYRNTLRGIARQQP